MLNKIMKTVRSNMNCEFTRNFVLASLALSTCFSVAFGVIVTSELRRICKEGHV